MLIAAAQCASRVFQTSIAPLFTVALLLLWPMPAKRKGPVVKVEPTPKMAKPGTLKRSLSNSTFTSESTEVPATATLSLPHVKMFTQW